MGVAILDLAPMTRPARVLKSDIERACQAVKAVGENVAGVEIQPGGAVLGHKDPNTAKIYTRSASQALMASDAMEKMGEKAERALSTR